MHEASKDLLDKLSSIYDERESSAIVDWVMEHLTGWRKVDRIINKTKDLSASTNEKLAEIAAQLLSHKPVQYIINEAWFYGMKLHVDENVLIPRPETEELVEWAMIEVDRLRMTVDGRNLRMLDVGTGSGCIAIAIKKERPALRVDACDVSAGALAVAKRNAENQKVNIEFRQLDFLNEEETLELPKFDLIVSNPPYISTQEESVIDKHVIEYEPHLALFVPEQDPLIFYKQLSQFGKMHLNADGCMMMEIHFEKGKKVKELFEQNGYGVEVRKDLQQKDRLVRVWHKRS